MNVAPYLTALAAVACYASLPVIAKKLLPDIPPLAFIGASMVVLALLALCASMLFEKEFSFGALGIRAWAGLVLFAAINLIGFALYLVAIQKIAVANYQLMELLSPLIGGALAFLLLAENLSVNQLFGFIVVAIGLFIALKDTLT